MKYFLDTHALIEIAEGSPKYEKYLESDTATLKDNLAELFYFLLKKYDVKTANFFLEKFARLAVELPIEVISKAMSFRYNNIKKGLSYIDCFGCTYAVENKMSFLTGDRAFEGMKGVELVR